ncbi:MAG: WD40 repeat domain-containing protein [Xanthobacteraceae bacterium]|nr:MAG: WD40 repeat domain-containing protein [Xanthobacteraceae bacterium]
MSEQAVASLAERVVPFDLGVPIIATRFLGATAAFACGEEMVALVGADGAATRVAVHGGAILCATGDARRIVTGGDDGRVVALDADGAIEVVATDAKRRWIDSVALHADGAVAWSAGKTVFVRTAKGDIKSLDVPSTPGGLAFAPRGFRLAIAHYNGVTLWFPNMAGTPEFWEWKGSHLAIGFSRDGKFLITAMHEPALHGWRVADQRHMRMSGYPSRVKSMDWSADGKWLATSGADELILWPFQSKDGPTGKPPVMLAAPNRSCVAALACHPAEEVVAAGYGDGTLRLVRVSDGAEIPVRAATAAGPDDASGAISALAWDARGQMLAFGCADGAAGLLKL